MACPTNGTDTALAISVLQKVYSSVNSKEEGAWVLSFDYLSACAPGQSGETGEGAIIRSGKSTYVSQIDEEYLVTGDAYIRIDNSRKTVELLISEGEAISSDPFHGANIGKYIQSVEIDTLPGKQMELLIQTTYGDIESAQVRFAADTYLPIQFVYRFRSGNNYGFDPGDCISITYKPMPGGTQEKLKERLNLSHYLRKDNRGNWQLSPNFSEYTLITP
jgi:hypothetical protein